MRIKETSMFTGLSIKTLHHFDNINLLSPKRDCNGYRIYEDKDISKLQTILFFRELEFPLKEIDEILRTDNFDFHEALKHQIKLLEIKQNRINSIIELAKKELGDNNMKKDFKPFDNSKFEQYEKETKEKWGKSTAYKECKNKLKGQSKKEIQMNGDEMMDIFRRFGLEIKRGINKETLALVKELQSFITEHYYRCEDSVLLELGEMYVSDKKFKENINKIGGPGTANFVNSCIKIYVN
jgi:DNA-binding transcriptional MerR regulator